MLILLFHLEYEVYVSYNRRKMEVDMKRCSHIRINQRIIIICGMILLSLLVNTIACRSSGPAADVSLLRPPVASFTFSPEYPDVDEPVVFDASASFDPDNTGISCYWAFGNTGYAIGAETTHTFSSEGRNEVTLVVTDQTGMIGKVTKTVYVTRGPIALFTWKAGTSAVHIDFDASSSFNRDRGSLTDYQWDFGDGSTGNGQKVSHLFDNERLDYAVRLTVSNETGEQMSIEEKIRIPYFISRKGSTLYEGKREYRFVSVNIPNYFIVEDRAGTTGSKWHRITEFEQRDAARAVKRLGGRLFRTYCFSVQGGRNVEHNLAHIYKDTLTGKIVYHEDLFRDVDRGIAIAWEEGVRMYIPLVDNWEWFGGCVEWEQITGGTDFWTDPVCRQAFKDFITYLLTRTNTYTGVRYRDDPTIMGWELGNELDKADAAWKSEMAAHIKSMDPNHLVIDGSHKSFYKQSLKDSNIDIVTTHYTDRTMAILAGDAAAAGKAYIYGEFSPSGFASVSKVVRNTIESNSAGCLIWSLRFRTEYGGFYYHYDFGGESDSLQYPGFPDTMPLDEREIFGLLRQGAYDIRGLPVPEEQVPPAPFLLPATTAKELNWQGSAGAFSYKVQRRSRSEGEWETVVSCVSDAVPLYNSDAVVARLPLISDEPGKGTWEYRVTAVNESGESTPSNIVGVVQ
jgi:mannan endo-1,4-beta-mannosidase